MHNSVSAVIQNLDKQPGATDQAIRTFLCATDFQLPGEYIEFLSHCNGAEGWVGKEAYMQFWPIEELVANNRDYLVDGHAPGLFLLGSDGGGRAYGFDTRSEPMRVIETHFEVLGWDHVCEAWDSFDDFLIGLASRQPAK